MSNYYQWVTLNASRPIGRTVQAINNNQDLHGLLYILNEIFFFNIINIYKFQCIQVLNIREETGDDWPPLPFSEYYPHRHSVDRILVFLEEPAEEACLVAKWRMEVETNCLWSLFNLTEELFYQFSYKPDSYSKRICSSLQFKQLYMHIHST